MNHLEKKMRYSNAFESLNSIRNILEFNEQDSMGQDERNIILDAIEIATEPTERSFELALLYGFYNTGDTIKSSALELAKAINDAVTKKAISSDQLNRIKTIAQRKEIALFEDNKSLIQAIDYVMVLLNKAKKEDVAESNLLLIKNLNIL